MRSIIIMRVTTLLREFRNLGENVNVVIMQNDKGVKCLKVD